MMIQWGIGVLETFEAQVLGLLSDTPSKRQAESQFHLLTMDGDGAKPKRSQKSRAVK
jgi:hypothetical protein